MGEQHRFRQKQFTIRLSDEEMEMLKKKLADSGIGREQYFRDMILFSVISKPEYFKMNEEAFELLLSRLHEIGNKINLIAYNTNLKKATGQEEVDGLQECYEELLQLYEDMILNADFENGEG